MREFNVTGLCVPGKHYMADTSEKIKALMKMVDKGQYFSINKARQYGKTTTLSLLDKALSKLDYTVIRISFEITSDAMDETESGFCQGLLHKCAKDLKWRGATEASLWKNETITSFDLLDDLLTDLCFGKKYVLIIDEVDKSSNNFVFLKFLGMLRDKYLRRNEEKDHIFHSVILAGVYDIKNLKIKMIQAGTHQLKDGEKRINSPWNIASEMTVDMSLSTVEITSMLDAYENDHHTGMDINAIAEEIRNYTNGYPYLVSRICMIIEEKLDRDWTINGVQKAIKIMLHERTTLIDDIAKNLNSNEDLKKVMYNIVISGNEQRFNYTDTTLELGLTFGFLIKEGDFVVIGNKFFEKILYEHFITEKSLADIIKQRYLPTNVIEDGKFNMPLVLQKFASHYYEMYHEDKKKFLENECRILFLTYLSPLINGGGYFHIESETRNATRMDVIVDYGTEQFIIELKLWYGDNSHEKALDQIAGYLDSKNKDHGYLVTFDFRKEENTGKPKWEHIEHSGKRIFDVIIGL